MRERGSVYFLRVLVCLFGALVSGEAIAQTVAVPFKGWTKAGEQAVAPGISDYTYFRFVEPYGSEPIGVVFGTHATQEPEFSASGIEFFLPPHNSTLSFSFRFFGTGGFPPGAVMSIIFASSDPSLLECKADGKPEILPISSSPALIQGVMSYSCENFSFRGISVKMLGMTVSFGGGTPSLNEIVDALGLRLEGATIYGPGGEPWTFDGSPLASDIYYCLTCGKPVNVVNGALWHKFTDFTVAGRTPETKLEFTRTYLSRSLLPGDFGANWVHNWETRIIPVDGTETPDLLWIDPSGGAWIFQREEDGSFRRPPGFFGEVSESSDWVTIRMPNGTRYVFSRKAADAPVGRLMTKIEPHGEEVRLGYDTNGNLATVSAPFAGSISFTRDAERKVVRVTRERDGLHYDYLYDSLGRLQRTFDLEGISAYRYFYASNAPGTMASGLLSQMIDPLGRSYTSTFDPVTGAVTSQTEPAGANLQFTYAKDAFGKSYTFVTNYDGSSLIYVFDTRYRLETLFRNGVPERASWTDANQLAAYTDPLGFVTKYAYDSRGNRTDVQKPLDPAPVRIAYDPNFSKPTSITPLVGAPTILQVDPSNGDVTSVRRSGGGKTLVRTIAYDDFGNARAFSNGTSSFSNQLDSNGLLTRAFDLRNPENRAYDSRGRVTRREFVTGRALNYSWDAYDRLVRVEDSAGPSVEFAYDRMDRILTRTISDGKTDETTTYVWDARDRLISETDTLGNRTSYEYDPIDPSTGLRRVLEQPIEKIDPNGNRTRFEYDLENRLSKIIDPQGAIVSFEYNARGDRTAVIDANGKKTTYVYDGNGRVVSRSRPSIVTNESGVSNEIVETSSYFYDAAGKLIREEKPSTAGGKSVAEYAYDPFDRLVRKTLKRVDSKGIVSIEDDSTFEYANELDQTLVTKAANGTIVLEFTYDVVPPYLPKTYSVRAAAPKNPLGLIEGTYQIVRGVTNEVETIRDAKGKTFFTAGYDPAARLLSIASGNRVGTAAGALSFAFEYDGFGRKTLLRSSTGYRQESMYDEIGRIAALEWSEPKSGGIIASLIGKYFGNRTVSEALTYDPAGNIVSQVREFGAFAYGYGSLNELTSVDVRSAKPVLSSFLNRTFDQTFAYDPAGNRTLASLDGGGAQFVNNQIVKTNTATYGSDGDGFGNLTAIRPRHSHAEKRMRYRMDGKLIEFTLVHDPDWDGDDDDDDAVVTKAEYFYDAFGRRVAKRIAEKSWEPWKHSRWARKRRLCARESVFTQAYSHLVLEDKILIARAGDGTLSLYLDGKGIDEHLGRISSREKTVYVTDHLGSVLNSPLGGEYRAYGPYGTSTWLGKILSRVRREDPVMYGFTGRQFDPESGLYYFRARMFEPGIGRFTSKDPIGFGGGDFNVYRYVHNGPASNTDPSGLIHPCTSESGYSGYLSPDAAVASILRIANPISITSQTEIGGNIFRAADGTYYIRDVTIGSESSVSIPYPGSKTGEQFVGQFHTHGDLLLGYFYSFSDTSLGVFFGLQYLGTPTGAIRVYDPVSNSVRRVY